MSSIPELSENSLILLKEIMRTVVHEILIALRYETDGSDVSYENTTPSPPSSKYERDESGVLYETVPRWSYAEED